ncbi:MAG: hypothetical protein QXL22_03815 [Candidatus Nezhaarchaeales archaeon]
MKVLDDLAICRMRVRLRAQTTLQASPTPAEVHGKKAWTVLRKLFETMVENSIHHAGGKVLSTYNEKDVALSAVLKNGTRTWGILLRGRIDLATLVYFRGSLFTVLFEVTEYKEASRVVRHRLQSYASALYGEIGFPIVPVLVIVRDHDTVEDVLVMSSDASVSGRDLMKVISRLMKTLSDEKEPEPPSGEICAFCDPPIRRVCPYTH